MILMLVILIVISISISIVGGVVYKRKAAKAAEAAEAAEALAQAEALALAQAEARFIPPFEGMVAWYDGDSFENNMLKDKSSNKNDVTDITGQLVKTENYLSGTINTKITFPANVLPKTFTFIHVARYAGTHKRRIFDSVKDNTLSGFWKGMSGVSHFIKSWKTKHTNNINSNWLLSVDTNKFYRGNGVDYTRQGFKQSGDGSQLSVNKGTYAKSESSDFEIAEMIIYERILSVEEIETIEEELMEKYNIH
jgi:hypothetical protein